MRDGTIVILTVAISLTILLFSYYWLSYVEPILHPKPTFDPYPKTPPTDYTVLSQDQFNVTQGESFQLNVNITSLVNETITFTPAVTLAGYGNARWDQSKDSHKIYNATFSQQELVLQPNVEVPLTLRFDIAEDSPPGRYYFYVHNVGLTVMVSSKPN